MKLMWDKKQAHQNTQHKHTGTDTARISITRVVEGIEQSSNYVEGESGAWINWIDGDVEFCSGYFRGDISAATGTFTSAIAVGTSPNWFKVDSSGNIWSGNATLVGAEANTWAATNAGVLYAKSAIIGGWNVNTTSIYTGTEDHSGYTANAGDLTIYSDGSDASIHAKNWYVNTSGVIYATGGVFDGTSTLGGRLGSTLATAIDSAGAFINANLDTSAKTILGSFTFSGSGAIAMATDANNGLWLSPTGLLGKTGGVNKFTIGIDGSAYFAGTFAAGLIIAADISTGLYNYIDANLPSDANLVGYWNFDEGKLTSSAANPTTYDNSGNGNNGSLYGTMTDGDYVAGIVGTGLDLDGVDDYVNCGNNSSFNFTSGDFTIVYWTKPTYVYNKVVICRGAQTVDGWYLNQLVANGISFLTHQAGVQQETTSNTNVLPNGTWSYVVVVRSGATATIYVNGVDQTSSHGTHINPTTSTKNLYIGSYEGGAIPMTGLIDEVRIYNVALTAKEVYALYKNPAGNKGVMVPTGRLTSGSIYSKQITLAVAAGTGDSFIAAGKTDFDNTASGFILGLDDSDSDLAKFYIGSSTIYMNWTGAALNVVGGAITGGSINITSGGTTYFDVSTTGITFMRTHATNSASITLATSGVMYIGGGSDSRINFGSDTTTNTLLTIGRTSTAATTNTMVVFSDAGTTANSAITLAITSASAGASDSTGNALNITKSGAGNAVYIKQDGSYNAAVDIVQNGATTMGLRITQNAAADAARFISASGSGAGVVVGIYQNSITSGACLYISGLTGKSAHIRLNPIVLAPDTPSEGDLYADTDHKLYYHNGTAWKEIAFVA